MQNNACDRFTISKFVTVEQLITVKLNRNLRMHVKFSIQTIIK